MKSFINLYRHSPLRYLVSIILLIIGLFVITRQISSFSELVDVEWSDFVEYWSASVLHIQGRNPYDHELLTSLQNSVGRLGDVPVIMWNPPWTLALIIPFASLDFPLAHVIWFFTHFMILLTNATILWQLYGGSQRFLWIAWLLCLTFAPALMVLQAGQISSLILLGVVGFLFFERRGQGFLAGAAAALVAIKPHVAYLFVFVFILWSLDKKKWSMLAGSILSLLLASLLVYIINPSTFTNYLFATQNYPPVAWATPTMGGISRYYLGEEKFWLQFVAPILGILWGVFYYTRRSKKWVWVNEIPLICLVSITTMAFGWTFDKVLVICALIQVAVWFGYSKRLVAKLLLLLAYLGVNLYIMISVGALLRFFWLAPVLLALYLFAQQTLAPTNNEMNGDIKPG